MDKESIINWSKVSELLANNKDSIRLNRIPNKYKKQVELIKRWEIYILNELKNI